MKKLFKDNIKIILSFTFGFLLAAGIGVCAYTISSSDVSYDNSSSGLTGDNVKDALDELYTTMSDTLSHANSIYYLSSVGVKTGNQTIDIKPYFPDDYNQLTADNFLLVGTGVNTVDTYGEKYNKTYNWTKSYDADTGILTVSAYVGYGGHKSYGQYNIYVVFGDINTK